MIYLCTNQTFLFTDIFEHITPDKALEIMSEWNRIQVDTETNGRDCHINDLLCVQFGNKKADTQIVVDLSTVDIRIFKTLMETKLLIFQNGKFDIQFFYNYGIIPRKVYDTMIVEQLLYLGYKHLISYSLHSITLRRCNIDIDKTVRGEIIWRGLDAEVIKYAARDVMYLEDILESQVIDLNKQGLIKAALLENAFVPVIAYLEWCGIRLDTDKWQQKMKNDKENLQKSIDALNNFIIKSGQFEDMIYVDTQGYLFSGYDFTPKVNINWASSEQVIKVAKRLGFDVAVKDKKTGEDKESVMEKHLKKQKGINDTFLKLYFGKGEPGDGDYFPGYSGSAKLVSSFGQGHLNAINPITGRIHTQYRQLGCDTGRMSCGSKDENVDLAKYKKLPSSKVTYPNFQQLPHDEFTRSCFVANPGNLWVSCDYAAIESRLGADIYNEKAMIEEYLHGSGDMHSLTAKMVFEELKDVPVNEIKKKFPHLRSAAKPIEFSQQFGGSAFAIQNATGKSLEEAQKFADAYAKGFPGIAQFKKIGSQKVRKLGYIMLSPLTGHKSYWPGHDKWIAKQKEFTPEFWEDYRLHHKGTGDAVARMVSEHAKEGSKYDRKALNSPTQGQGAVILKHSQIAVFNWVVEHGYFGKILLNNLTHDEANWEYPEELKEFPNILKSEMEKSASVFCKSLPIPAEASVGKFWIH